MFKLSVSGKFDKTSKWLRDLGNLRYDRILDDIGNRGVLALEQATPIDTRLTAGSWYYEVHQDDNGYYVGWYNRNVNDGVNIAALIQLGHATGTGGYVSGYDYINPALRPIFEDFLKLLSKAVT